MSIELPDFGLDALVAEAKEATAQVERYERAIESVYGWRKRALEDAVKFVETCIVPLVDKDVAKVRADESLEPKPGWMVSGQHYVNHVIPIACYLMGDRITTGDGRYGSYATFPRDLESDKDGAE